MSLDGDRWLGLLGLRSFRVLLWFGIAAIVSLILSYASIGGMIPGPTSARRTVEASHMATERVPASADA